MQSRTLAVRLHAGDSVEVVWGSGFLICPTRPDCGREDGGCAGLTKTNRSSWFMQFQQSVGCWQSWVGDTEA
eukprot:3606751-Rhodomonas_salina.1